MNLKPEDLLAVVKIYPTDDRRSDRILWIIFPFCLYGVKGFFVMVGKKGGSHMPVTLHILLDDLSPYHSLAFVREHENPVFQAVRKFDGDLETAALTADYLYACSFSEAVKAKKKYPHLYYLCPKDRGLVKQADQVQAGMIFIDGKLDGLLFYEIERVFQRMKDWERRMRKSLFAQRGIQDLLNISEPMIDGQVVVYDASFNILAQSRGACGSQPELRSLFASFAETSNNHLHY